MLVLGICNPKGEADTYNGLYFTEKELAAMVQQRELLGLPIRTEHGTGDVGKILSSFVRNDGALQCLFELDGSDIEHKIAQGFVRDGIALELSMGYTVDVQQTNNNTLTAGSKKTLEVSLVKKGARDGCHILAIQDTDSCTKFRSLSAAQSTNQQKEQKESNPAAYFSMFNH